MRVFASLVVFFVLSNSAYATTFPLFQAFEIQQYSKPEQRCFCRPHKFARTVRVMCLFKVIFGDFSTALLEIRSYNKKYNFFASNKQNFSELTFFTILTVSRTHLSILPSSRPVLARPRVQYKLQLILTRLFHSGYEK